MKRINYLMFVSLLMAFAFSVMSCNKDKDDDDVDVDLSKAIVGIWDYTSSGMYIDGKTENDFFRDHYKDYYKEHLTEWEEIWGEIEDYNEDGVADYKDVAAAIDIILKEDPSDYQFEGYTEFTADGHVKTFLKYEDGDEDTMLGKYVISGNKICLIPEEDDEVDDEEDDEEDDEDEWYEVSIKGNTLSLKKEDEYETRLDGKKHTRLYTATYTKR